MSSIIQTNQTNHPQETTRYDAHGWPINPATGEAYDFDELVANLSLPLPKTPGAVLAARAKVKGDLPPVRKRRSCRNRRRTSSRRHNAAAVLARDIARGPFDAGMKATARRLTELNDADDDIPFNGEPCTPTETGNTAEYGLQSAL